MKKRNKKILNDKGITGIDLTIALILLSIFAGLIITLMSNMYKNSIEIQKGANAMAYATIILEKVDEKSYEEIEENFVKNLENEGEIVIDKGYTVSFSTDTLEEDLLKKVVVKVFYDINGEQKSITINKLKVKEIYIE